MTAMVPRVQATLRLPVQFRLEAPVTADEVVMLVKDVLPLREENFHLGQRGSGAKFNPDFDTITKLMVMGTMRWITARNQGQLIGLQQWCVVPHLWSQGLMLAICDSIIGGRRRGIDINAFVQYGVAAMRAVGASRVYYSAPIGSSFEKVLDFHGAKPLDIVMEIP